VLAQVRARDGNQHSGPQQCAATERGSDLRAKGVQQHLYSFFCDDKPRPSATRNALSLEKHRARVGGLPTKRHVPGTQATQACSTNQRTIMSLWSRTMTMRLEPGVTAFRKAGRVRPSYGESLQFRALAGYL
jgi:hypothetical protein